MLPLILPLLGGVAASTPETPPRSEGLKWGPCEGLDNPDNLPVECTNLVVPLDYADDAGDETLELDLIRYPAQVEPRLGSILLNFGGPGQDGLNGLVTYGPIQFQITGGQFDLVSWDPRGTGKTLPFSCFPTEDGAVSVGSTSANASDAAAGQLWTEGGIVSQVCYDQLKDYGDLVGMAHTARDMNEIVDALCEDGMLKYWGLSGGTILGATYAALFPNKVGSMLLDGVVNSHEYYYKTGETEMVSDTDKTMRGFLAGCVAYPENCALARPNKTAEDLEEDLYAFFQDIRLSPIPFPDVTGPLDSVTYAAIHGRFFLSLYRPIEYPMIAAVLDGLMQGNATLAGILFAEEAESAAVPKPAPEAILGIRGGDKVPRVGSLDGLRSTYLEYEEATEFFIDVWGSPNTITCAQWKFEAKGRYMGNFDVETANPILFIGNTYDPVTPLVSAKNMTESFRNGVLLHHNGFGHVSLADRSDCTNEYIRKFFVEGEYPEEGTICEPNFAIFDPARPTDLLS